MKVAGLLFTLCAVAAPLAAQSAPRMTTTLPPAELAQLEAVRKAVWVDWYGGDTTALRRSLGPELVSITSGGQTNLEQAIARSAEYHANGNKLTSVRFDSTSYQRFGDVVVMFSRYTTETTGKGKKETTTGHATEVFVKNGNRWVHTSWHLDEVK